MTENEALLSALKKVKEQKENFGFMDRFNVDENWEVMKALEEIQQYRAIGTIEEFKALKEKVEPKKPLPKGTHKGIDNFYCPNCNHPLTNRHEQCELPYCDICGQKLDWSE